MKREGRQHGVVRTYPILETTPLSQQRYVKNNTVDPAIVTGMFTKVSGKPTNQSKFTGKCGTARCNECQESDPELVSCGTGASATDAFAYLAGEGSYNDDHEEYEGEIDVYESDDDSDTTFDEYEGELGIVSEEPIRVEGDYCDVGLCWAEGDAQEYEDDEWCLID